MTGLADLVGHASVQLEGVPLAPGGCEDAGSVGSGTVMGGLPPKVLLPAPEHWEACATPSRFHNPSTSSSDRSRSRLYRHRKSFLPNQLPRCSKAGQNFSFGRPKLCRCDYPDVFGKPVDVLLKAFL